MERGVSWVVVEETTGVTDKEGRRITRVGTMDCRTVGVICGMDFGNQIMDRFPSRRAEVQRGYESDISQDFTSIRRVVWEWRWWLNLFVDSDVALVFLVR